MTSYGGRVGQVPARVEVRGVRRDYGSVTALHAVDLDIAGGEFVSLLGPSGSGKTTLLRCIAGLNEPTAGEIRVAGASVAGVPPYRRNLGMVFQSYALFPHMSVAENVGFGLRLRRVVAAEASKRVADMLDLVEMGAYGARRPSELSGGQQQRVALARALVTQPAVLLLDEPFGALDAKLRATLQVELRAMQRRLGVTAIFVTHDQQEALSMSDRVAVLSEGRVHQFDTPTRVYDTPSTAFVAGFVGQVNVLDSLPAGADGTWIEMPDLAVGSQGAPHRPVRAMVRPERVRLAAAGAVLPSGTVAVAARVTDLVFKGDTILTRLASPVGELVSARKNGDPATLPEAGGNLIAYWRAADMLLFPAS